MYQCSICQKVLRTRSGFIKHELAHKVTFKCQWCGKQYRRKSGLKIHENRIHGHDKIETQFTCSICDKKFLLAKDLKLHGKSHNQLGSGQQRSAINDAAEIRSLHPTGIDRFDLVKFLSSVKSSIEKYLFAKVQHHSIKWYLVSQVELTRENQNGEIQTAEPYFRSLTYTFLTKEDFEMHDLNHALQKIVIGLEKYIHESSGWVLKTVKNLDIHTVSYKPLRGSCHIELPKTLEKSHTILNIRNDDNKCFTWAILSALHPIYINPYDVGHYKPYEKELNMLGISYPVPLSKVNRFERQNIGISINIFGFESNEIYPLRITKQKNRKNHINLLFLQNDESSHYCLIKDLNAFLHRTKTTNRRAFFCPYCLQGFSRQDLLDNHIDLCCVNGEQKIILPTKGKDDILKFTDFRKKLKCPFVIYCDFETVNRDVLTCRPNPEKSATTRTKQLDVCSYGYKRICTDSRYTKECVIFRGPNASSHFIESLLKEEQEIKQILKHIEPLIMTEDDEVEFASAKLCSICNKEFDEDERDKVIDHDHLSGFYRGPAHSICNLQFQINSFIPIIFHGLRNFDSHVICQSIGQYETNSKRIKCIPQNMERYVSFSLGDLRFIDSFQFLGSSLECLTENLKATGGISNFKHFSSEFKDEHEANLLLRKNVYPYDYMNDESTFFETEIPPKEAFYSNIKKSDISDEDYYHACNVYRTLKLRNLGEYSDLYLKTDVLLLSDIFENFRTISLRDYDLDPCHFYSAPGLSWAAMLLMTKVNLELITEIDDLLLWERACRGGVSQISDRYAVANNPYMKSYNPDAPTTYIEFLDANNLYGWACQQPLPVRNFRRLTEDEFCEFDVLNIADDSEKGYLLMVSMDYPPFLHDDHNCFPLAPVKRSITDYELSAYAKNAWAELRGASKRPNNKKLLCTLEDKDHYVLHYRNLKLYLSLGLQLKKIHAVIEFEQEAWLKPYIDFNTRRRMEAKTEFEKTFYKILNCSVFGKLMECQRKHLDVEMTNNEKRLTKLTAKPTFKECRIFNESLVGVHCKRSKVLISKPIYAGQTVLDLSKVLMYQFWYGYIKKKYANQCHLLCTDTDSLLFHVHTIDIYEDMKRDSIYFDFSDFPKSHPLYSETFKKVPGKFKYELNDKIITKFIGLRSKMYALSYQDNEKDREKKKAKGVAKATIEKELSIQMYENTLFDRTEILSSMDLIRSRSHNIYCETVRKKTLSCFDDKRYLLNDGLSSLAYGHYAIGYL